MYMYVLLILIICLLVLYGIVVFVEKVLRVQPNVKKLYLLLRATDAESATRRLNNEVCHNAFHPIKLNGYENVHVRGAATSSLSLR